MAGKSLRMLLIKICIGIKTQSPTNGRVAKASSNGVEATILTALSACVPVLSV